MCSSDLTLVELIQIGLLSPIKHFPADRKMNVAPYHRADQLQLVRMIFAARMGLADVDHICIRNSIPELRLFRRLLAIGRRNSREKAQKTQK